jgi:hypothetical protein
LPQLCFLFPQLQYFFVKKVVLTAGLPAKKLRVFLSTPLIKTPENEETFVTHVST